MIGQRYIKVLDHYIRGNHAIFKCYYLHTRNVKISLMLTMMINLISSYLESEKIYNKRTVVLVNESDHISTVFFFALCP